MGSPISRWASVFYTRKELGLTSLEKLQSHSRLRIGAQSVGHPVYVRGRLVAWLLGLKEPAYVTGYSAPEMEVAFRQGYITSTELLRLADRYGQNAYGQYLRSLAAGDSP